jgi:hypothetical protein
MPRSPGHAFYDKLQTMLIASEFDRFVETQCASKYASRRGRPSLPPGRYFRMLLVGYFEGIDVNQHRSGTPPPIAHNTLIFPREFRSGRGSRSGDDAAQMMHEHRLVAGRLLA